MLQFIDRGYKNDLILLPGWASDGRIFQTLNLNYNYFLFDAPVLNPDAYILPALKGRQLKKALILGWSQGTYPAAEFAAKFPEKAAHLILVGARPKYPAVDINTARHGIIKNARGFLLNFYRDCFAAEEKENYHWFKQTLQKVYLEKFNREPLLSSLAKLENSALDSRALAEIKNLTFIHGQDDKIAPVEEIKEFAKTLPQAHCHLIENCGHLPFLRGEFAAIFTRYTQTKP